MARGLSRLQPDIVCLQESLKSVDGSLDTAAYLGHHLGLTVTFGPGRFKRRSVEEVEHDCYSGLAILARSTPSTFRLDSLPACPEDPDRTALTALYQLNGRFICVTNTHLTHVAGRDALRDLQLTTALDCCRLLAGQAGNGYHEAAMLCCGDMNRNLDPDVLGRIEIKTGVRIEDCYLAAGGSLPGYTFGLDDGAPCRLDYILNLRDTDGPSPRFAQGRVILSEKDPGGVAGSDHFGVMVDMELS